MIKDIGRREGTQDMKEERGMVKAVGEGREVGKSRRSKGVGR